MMTFFKLCYHLGVLPERHTPPEHLRPKEALHSVVLAQGSPFVFFKAHTKFVDQ